MVEAYSTCGRTGVLYASSFTDSFLFLTFLFYKSKGSICFTSNLLICIVTSLTVSHTGFTEHIIIIKGECGDCRFPVFWGYVWGLYWTNNGE